MKPDPPERSSSSRSAWSLLALAAGASASGQGSGTSDLRIAVPAGTMWAPAIAAIAFIAISGLFATCEAAMFSLKPHHLKRLAEDSPLSRRLRRRMDARAEIVAALAFGGLFARIGLFVCGLMLSLFSASALATGAAENGRSPGYLLLTGAVLAAALPLVALQFVAGVLAPRSLGNAHPLAVASRLSGLIGVTSALLGTPARALVGVTEYFRRIVAPRLNEADSASEKEEEIRTLVDSAEESGAIESDEKELITSVFEFTDTVAREVMTPRTDLDAMPVESDAQEIVEVVRSTGHSRIPLFDGTDDNIVGIVHAKDLLLAMVSYQPIQLRSLMRPLIHVPESRSLHGLLREMRAARTQIAVVQDEFGGTAGIVTIEDIIEELVGEIQDEYDEEDAAMSETADGYLIEGRTPIDDVNEAIGTHFESEDFDTIGGFVFGLFGRQPKALETVDAEGFRFTVVETDGRRIHRLRLEPCSEPVA